MTVKPAHEFHRQGSIRITWQWRERQFVCWRPHVSQVCTTRSDVLKFARWPASTPTGQLLRDWLDQILQQPAAGDQQPPGLTPEEQALAAATGFGPEQHDDADHDPTANTRTII